MKITKQQISKPTNKQIPKQISTTNKQIPKQISTTIKQIPHPIKETQSEEALHTPSEISDIISDNTDEHYALENTKLSNVLHVTVTMVSQQDSKESQSMELSLKPWTSVIDLKRLLQKKLNINIAEQRLFLRGQELRNHSWRLSPFVDQRARIMLCRRYHEDFLTNLPEKSLLEVFAHVPMHGEHFATAIHEARKGLLQGIKPKLALEGMGGTYFLSGQQESGAKPVLIFKPGDEEPGGFCNPRGLTGPLGEIAKESRGIGAGSACFREVAAYLIDFNSPPELKIGVPSTVLAELTHPALHYPGKKKNYPKFGSLQCFHQHDWVGTSFPHSMRQALHLEKIQKLAIFDMRILNTDRNEGNLLISKKQGGNLEICPIDHAYCLPPKLNLAWCDWVWFGWEQVKAPLSEELKNAIADIDPFKDAEVLRRELCYTSPTNAQQITALPNAHALDRALDHLICATLLLQHGAKQGLTLHQIASLMARKDLDTPSRLELAINTARSLSKGMVKHAKIRGKNYPSRFRSKSSGKAKKILGAPLERTLTRDVHVSPLITSTNSCLPPSPLMLGSAETIKSIKTVERMNSIGLKRVSSYSIMDKGQAEHKEEFFSSRAPLFRGNVSSHHNRANTELGKVVPAFRLDQSANENMRRVSMFDVESCKGGKLIRLESTPQRVLMKKERTRSRGSSGSSIDLVEGERGTVSPLVLEKNENELSEAKKLFYYWVDRMLADQVRHRIVKREIEEKGSIEENREHVEEHVQSEYDYDSFSEVSSDDDNDAILGKFWSNEKTWADLVEEEET